MLTVEHLGRLQFYTIFKSIDLLILWYHIYSQVGIDELNYLILDRNLKHEIASIILIQFIVDGHEDFIERCVYSLPQMALKSHPVHNLMSLIVDS